MRTELVSFLVCRDGLRLQHLQVVAVLRLLNVENCWPVIVLCWHDHLSSKWLCRAAVPPQHILEKARHHLEYPQLPFSLCAELCMCKP